MFKALRIKQSPTGIYLVAGLLILNGLMNLVINLSTSLESVFIMGAGVLIAAAFIGLAIGLLQHKLYAWALVTAGSGIGVIGFSWQLVTAILYLQDAEGALLIYLTYAVLLIASAGIFYYLALTRTRLLFRLADKKDY